MSWQHSRHWVFDMDGTLTVAVHDFEAIKRALEIPQSDDILHHLAALPAAEAASKHAWLLAHERELLVRLAAQVEQRWDDRQPHSLIGRTVLIVGAGDIGLNVAQFLAPFGIKLLGIASHPRPLAPFTQVCGLDDLPCLVGEADYVINLLPDTARTRDIYDAKLFARCKPSALFINAGRGVAVVDADLVTALERGQLAGAVIDVCRKEPLPAGHPFWHAPRLLLTGHSAAPTDPRLLVQLFVDNLARWRGGDALRGRIDFVRGY